MRKFAWSILIFAALILALSCGAYAARVLGEVTETNGKTITATFPVPVQPHSMLIVLVDESEAVAGMAICKKCEGDGPYLVTGELEFVSDASALVVGKKVYVNSANAPAALPAVYRPTPGTSPTSGIIIPRKRPTTAQDLKLYYYAAGQTVGYGALGLGYERNLRLTKGLELGLDAGIAGIGNVNAADADTIDSDQLIKSLNGRLKFDLTTGFGVYTGYRWNEGKGDEQRWNYVASQIHNINFVAPSAYEAGTVLNQGIEYGLALQPSRKFNLLLGYIPSLRTDYGSYGVSTMPAYTAEMRFGVNKGAFRLRGIRTQNYWLADIGITIK